MPRKIDVIKGQAALGFPQAAVPPKPKADRNGRKQILTREESAHILGIRYDKDSDPDA